MYTFLIKEYRKIMILVFLDIIPKKLIIALATLILKQNSQCFQPKDYTNTIQ